MSSPPEYTGKPEDFLSRRYRGQHIPMTDAEKLWADAAKLQDDLDIFSQDLNSTKKVLNRLLNYERTIAKLEGEAPEPPPPAESEAVPAETTNTTHETVSDNKYDKLSVLLDEMTKRVDYYEKYCVGRMTDFLVLEREYKPVLRKCDLTVREDVPTTEARRLRSRIYDLLERFANEQRRLKELRRFVREDQNFKGFDAIDKKK